MTTARRATGSRPENGRPAPPSVEILDIAFRRAQKVSPHGKTKPERVRLRAELKVIRSSATVLRHLRLELRPLRPPALGEFERSLVQGAFGAGSLDRSLLRLKRAEERIRRLTREAEKEVSRAAGSEELGELIRRFYGRLSSFVREIDTDIVQLRDIASYLKERPSIDLSVPRVVVAGFPNVGKSSLVSRLSSARPKVAEYPFTTVAISVGHADLGFDRLQVVDTPGVLNRPRRENLAEVEAETTVARVATTVLFVLDPSDSSGYSIEEQERLLARWREEFPELDILPVETKCDLARRPTDHLQVSAVTGEGIEALLSELSRRIAQARKKAESERGTEPPPPEESAGEPRRTARSRAQPPRSAT